MASDKNENQQLTIVLTGGGSGGHITPILAVAHELKRQNPRCTIIYIGERDGKFSHMTRDSADIDKDYHIYAGKFRRYHGESWLRRVSDVRTNLLNLRDVFYVIAGFFQSLRLLGKLKPQVVFLKGGFVGMPVGLAAATRNIQFITHDSDAVPGLANKVVSRWATLHATGMPPEFYDYPKESVRHVGVLVSDQFKPVTQQLQKEYRKELGIPPKCMVVLVTGGSLGAMRLNKALVQIAPGLLEDFSDLQIIHQVGKGHAGVYEEFVHPRLQILEFMKGMHRFTGAANIVVTRAGANTLAELGVQGKACIVVPNPQLSGGHQLKNALRLNENGAVITVNETAFNTDAAGLAQALQELLKDRQKADDMALRLQQMTIADASHKLAVLLLDVATR
jgi:UDP-N-acetylglucosamine--N-acetylmuramyl-(pentapeptide) pyrophosphoryl-undecaprenol N-acetylglucosamine transferase